jgi:hypothetical protein
MRKYMEFAAGLALAATIIASPAFAGTYAARATDEIKFESLVRNQEFINIEDGPLVVTPIKEEAWSSRWYLEPVGESDYVRIKNRWTGCYLNIEKGPLVCGPKDDGWWSAQWRIVNEIDTRYFVINRWTDCRLSKAGTGLMCNKDDRAGIAETLWKPLNLTPQTVFVRRRPKPAAPPEPSRGDKIAALGGCAVELLTTDGPFPDRICLPAEGEKRQFGGSWNDDIEVIVIKSPNIKVIGYEHANFTGNKVTLNCGDTELIGDPENEISSMKIFYSETPFTNQCVGNRNGPLGTIRNPVRRWDF